MEEDVALMIWSSNFWRTEENIYSNAWSSKVWRKVLLCWFGVLKRVELHGGRRRRFAPMRGAPNFGETAALILVWCLEDDVTLINDVEKSDSMMWS